MNVKNLIELLNANSVSPDTEVVVDYMGLPLPLHITSVELGESYDKEPKLVIYLYATQEAQMADEQLTLDEELIAKSVEEDD